MAHLVMLALLLKGKYVKLLNSLQFLPGAELLAALRHPGREVVCQVSKRGWTTGRGSTNPKRTSAGVNRTSPRRLRGRSFRATASWLISAYGERVAPNLAYSEAKQEC